MLKRANAQVFLAEHEDLLEENWHKVAERLDINYRALSEMIAFEYLVRRNPSYDKEDWVEESKISRQLMAMQCKKKELNAKINETCAAIRSIPLGEYRDSLIIKVEQIKLEIIELENSTKPIEKKHSEKYFGVHYFTIWR